MSQEQIDTLRKKIFNKEKKLSLSETIVTLAREVHCLGDILGQDYDVFDPNGKLVFKIRQKPLKSVQLNIILDALTKIKQKEADAIPKSRGKR